MARFITESYSFIKFKNIRLILFSYSLDIFSKYLKSNEPKAQMLTHPISRIQNKNKALLHSQPYQCQTPAARRPCRPEVSVNLTISYTQMLNS